MALPVSTWSGQKIVTVVSRNTGLANDTNGRSACLDYINLGLMEISSHTPWDWLATQMTDITMTATVATYNLATGSGSEWDSVYDVRLVGANERTLDALDRRTYDRYRRRYQTSTNVPTHYLIYGAQQNAVIELVPTPSVADTLRIRYILRAAHLSDSTGSSLAMVDRFVPMVIYKGMSLVSAWKDPERMSQWEAMYQRSLARNIDRDRVSPDENPAFSPQVEHAAQRIDYVNPDDLTWYPR